MRLTAIITAVAAVSAACVFAVPADAQSRRQQAVVTNSDGTVVVSRDESGRRRTQIILQKRSFLDAGTEVLPGERKFTEYVYPLGYSPTSVIDGTVFSHRSPLPGPFDLPGKDNPYPWGN
jgi:hypothetical protein